MRKLVWVVIGCTILLIRAEESRAAEKRYQIKSGYIKYEISGYTDGIQEIYFDNYGQKEFQINKTTVNMFGVKKTTKSKSLIDGDWMYSIEGNKATKYNYKEMMQVFAKKNNQGAKAFSEDMIKAMGGKKAGSDKVLGKKCDVYEFTNMGNKACIYKGMPLRTTSNMMGMEFNMQAVEFKENIKIDPEQLALPAGIKVVDGPPIDYADMPDMKEMQESMKKMNEMQNQLKESGEYQEMMEQMKAMQNQDFQKEDGSDEAGGGATKAILGGVLKSLF